MDKIRDFFELNFFGVCSKLAEKMGISTFSVRLFFVHACFLTFGSPIIVYLGLVWLQSFRRYRRKKHHPAFW
ncbi:MAG: PspC domain-containing protein [Verrucomicrobia bacterium]|jgi:phage shock protein C|nr:PspC domain-containing protein [Cytophagales bacterium]